MNWFGSLIVGIAVSIAGVVDTDAFKKDPKPEDFVGTWEGNWDGSWFVRLTITPGDEEGTLHVVYEWQEQRETPLSKLVVTGKLNEDVLHVGRMIEMSVEAENPDKAFALGKFAKTRQAFLKRVPKEEEKETETEETP